MPNSSVCIDANIVIRRLMEPANHAVQQLWQEWRRADVVFHAPTLLPYEVANALYQYYRRQLITTDTLDGMIRAALAIPISLSGDTALHFAALDEARTFSLPASYDAHYLALGRRLGLDVWTTDEKFANRVTSSKPAVRLVGRDRWNRDNDTP